MPINEYPFIAFTPESPGQPMLMVRIVNPENGRSIYTYGIVSTSAQCCAIPASFANLLGHNLMLGKPRYIYTGNGTSIAYSHDCEIEIFDTNELAYEQWKVVYRLNRTPVEFMPNLKTVVLGAGNFLNRFTVHIDYGREVFSIKKPTDKPDLVSRLYKYRRDRI